MGERESVCVEKEVDDGIRSSCCPCELQTYQGKARDWNARELWGGQREIPNRRLLFMEDQSSMRGSVSRMQQMDTCEGKIRERVGV
eukprot:1142739-Rhodomonas_salina.2